MINVIHKKIAIERGNDLKERLKDFDYKLVEPQQPLDGQWSLSRTHIALIKKAKAENMPYIIVAEDDLLPTDNIRNLPALIAEADELEADVLLAGVCFSHRHKKITETMYRGNTFDGTQLVVYFKRMYHRAEDMLNVYTENGKHHAKAISPILTLMRFRTFIGFPFCAYQQRYADSMCQSVINFNYREDDFLATAK